MLRFRHPHRAILVEAIGEGGGEARRHVLGDEDGRAVGGQPHQHVLERLDSAGGGADQHDLAGGASELRTLRHGCRRDTLVAPDAGSGRGLHLVLQLAGQGRHLVDDVVRRLGDEIDRADLKRLERHLGADLGERGDHHDRHRAQRHDLAQEGHAVHERHLDVEGDDIGMKRLDALARDVRIGRGADHLDLRIGRQQRRQQLPHQRGIVDDENTYLRMRTRH